MPGSIIKLSGNNHWGTAFAIVEQDGLVFHTATHVLRDIGLTAVGQTRQILMCDDRLRFLVSGPELFDLTVTRYDPVCDLATFRSNFPARPFARSTHQVQVDDELRVTGYLPTGEQIQQPDCGVFLSLDGRVTGISSVKNCATPSFLVALRAPVLHLYGMSGGPATLPSHPSEVIGLLNGALHDAGGPPFIVSPI